jgi:hypothetical protein
VDRHDYDEMLRSLAAIQEHLRESIPRLDAQLQAQRAILPRLEAILTELQAMMARYDAMSARYDARIARQKRDEETGRDA